jgi:hypothetical protein
LERYKDSKPQQPVNTTPAFIYPFKVDIFHKQPFAGLKNPQSRQTLLLFSLPSPQHDR